MGADMDDLKEAFARVDARLFADKDRSPMLVNFNDYCREVDRELARIRRERTWWMRLWRKAFPR